ncbi:MAG: hypothetical protein ABL895_05900 [Cyclobacteriaceae bacterium]
MKQLALFKLISLVLITNAEAQVNPIHKGLGCGLQVIQYQKDFGIGLNATGPYFANDRIAIRARVNMVFNEHLKNGTITWTPYSNASLGIIGVAGYVGDFIKLYGEGGMIWLFPSADFSSKEFMLGGYGLFGFEFYMNNSNCYFLEIGGVGTGATADLVSTKPIYSNGLIISAGFRLHKK